MLSAQPVKGYYDSRRFLETKPGVILILCRHGATAANDAPVPLVRGWEDFPLDENGLMETQLLAYKLRKFDPKKIVHSDFMRDSRTAHIIANAVVTNDVEVDYDLRTFDVGEFSGKPLKEVNPAILEIYKNPWMTPPGGSESFNGFVKRFTNCLDKYLTMATIDQFRPILLVTHGKNIAMASTYINGGNAWESPMPEPSGYAIISVKDDRSLGIELSRPIENVIEDL